MNNPPSILRRNNTLVGNRVSVTGSTRSSMLARSIDRSDRRSLLSTPLTRRTPSTSTYTVTQTPDERPIRNKNYQNLITNEIYEFLSMNKFELEMNHPLTSKTLKIPTQKDFMVIFQFLYNKIDPFYKFTKSIDNEVITILKMLRYPYIESITRSQISAVGGNNWPNFLGILYWLVKLNLQIMEFGDPQRITLEDELDGLFVNYTTKCYENFLNNEDDNEKHTKELNDELQKFNDKIDKEIVIRTEKKKQLNQQLDEINEYYEQLKYGQKTTEALENDIVKIQAYLESTADMKFQWANQMDILNTEITKYEDKINKARQEKQQLNTKLSQKGINVLMIEKLTNEKLTIIRNIDIFNDKIRDIDIMINEKTKDMNKIITELQQKIQEYNGSIYKMELNDYLPREKYQINLKFNYLNFNRNDLNEILNKDLKTDKIEFIKVKNISKDSIRDLKDLIQKNSIEISKVTQINDEKDRKLRNIEMINSSKISEINDKEIENEFKLNEYNKYVERAEYEITEMKVKKEEEFLQDQNNLTTISEEFEKTLDEIDKKRKILMVTTSEISAFIQQYEHDVNSTLKDLESFIAKEVEEL
ncbi:probable kinetochore protein Ndc80p [[Candida] jaroonii]|uniref:Probable kinetochore protein Ndc80p n=1 Tax=[Candida] jaroonii TaxID=467808 RepID=A0ACA9Y6C9_9ASCO|nr:probable kinetochore protein Ndc80p [[Candida] jaroonii]